jgi:hypothetical protein
MWFDQCPNCHKSNDTRVKGYWRQWEAFDCPDLDSIHNDGERHLSYVAPPSCVNIKSNPLCSTVCCIYFSRRVLSPTIICKHQICSTIFHSLFCFLVWTCT